MKAYNPKKRKLIRVALSGIALALTTATVQATTYYVNSAAGNDSNSGTAPNAAWQSLTKVDSSAFQPGDSVLLADGSNWYGQQLVINSSGTVSAPITFSNYGSGADPTIWGSIPLDSSSFQGVGGASGTYFISSAALQATWSTYSKAAAAGAPATAVFLNHDFLKSAALDAGATDPVSYVESNSGSWYYDAGSAEPGLYVNAGQAIGGLAIGALTATVVGGGANPYASGVVFTNGQSNLVLQNLSVRESAAYNSGYGISVFGGSNVQLLNSSVSGAGKHAFAAIDTTGFVGRGLNASYLMPDQGYGGATAYVAYSDFNSSNDTSQWVNDVATNLNGSYPAFYTHSVPSASDPTPISSVLVKNMQISANGMAAAISGIVAGAGKLTVQGGNITNGGVVTYGNTTVDGVTLTGSSAQIQANGSGNIIQNNLVTGAAPNWEAGNNGAIVDNGTGNIIRFNTVVVDPAAGLLAPAIGLGSATTGTQIYGNVLSAPGTLFFVEGNGTATPNVQALSNLFSSSGGTGKLEIVYWQPGLSGPVATSVPTSITTGNLSGQPDFSDTSSGNYSLLPGSVAAYAFDPSTSQYVMYDIYGNIRPITGDSIGAIQTVPEPAAAAFLAGISVFVFRRRFS